MKILVACEESQAVTIEFRKLGHEAYLCDLLPCSGGHPEWHLQQDVIPLLAEYWDMVIGFPTCTYLTISANKWYKDQPARKSGALVGAARRAAREQAIKFFMCIYNANSPKVAVENPIGVMSTVFRKPDQVLQPWMFGHPETKATCLWLHGLPKLTRTNEVDGREQRLHRLPPTDDRAILRSKTYSGIAQAMANQWTQPCPK
jgi:hypothetical protein